MKIRVQPAEVKETIIPAYAEGVSPEGWGLTYDEGKVFLNFKKDYIALKGFSMSKDQLESLIQDLEEFRLVVLGLE